MRLSKSAISKHPSGAALLSWKLAQTFWVGGLWVLYFAVLPGLGQIGLAPLLIEEVSLTLSPLLVAFTAFCAVLQLMVLAHAQGVRGLLQDRRCQLLLAVLVLVLAYFVVRQWQPNAVRWLLFNYLLLAFSGVLLIAQPLPGQQRIAEG